MTGPVRLGAAGLTAAAGAIVTLAAVSTIGLAAATDGLHHRSVRTTPCAVPALAGHSVRVSLADVGGAMGAGQRMSQHDWPRFRHGMMRVSATPDVVPAGTVSLRVDNTGYLAHEVVVLPLPAGQLAGQRVIGDDGKVNEDGSVGEVSATCAAGTGEGIAAGSSGWLTVTLAPGRYELLCNLPGHYAGGMYTELDLR